MMNRDSSVNNLVSGIDKYQISSHTKSMKKKHVSHRKHHHSAVIHAHKPKEGYLVIVRSWMLLVMFALMLGLGAVVGTYLNAQSEANTPTVAGVQVEVK